MSSRGVDLSDDNQADFLQQASKVVKQQGYLMQAAIDRKSLKEALKHASVMLCELRTGLLTPKNYYELYMEVCDQLRVLEMFFADQHREGRALTDMYQLVQHAGNVLPRLYLLVTVGGVYIRSEKGAACEILKDLVEMCKGVQHPLRGLFLRNYLSQVAKDKLPDVGTEYATEGGTDVAIDFVLQNFGEMNRLWVRMQHQGRGRTARPRREAERQDLRILVGTNLVRLSQMEGVTQERYVARVLPGVLEQVVGCKDRIAQAYLLDCIVQVFPDDFHLATLSEFLEACVGVHEGVDVRQPLMSLMDRLASHAEARTAQGSDGIPSAVNAFGLFSDYAGRIVEARKAHMETRQILELQVALLRFSLRCYPDALDNVNAVLDFSSRMLASVTNGKVESNCVSTVTALLTVPLEKLGLSVFQLSAFPGLMGYLAWAQRRGVARALVKRVLAGNGEGLDNQDTLSALLSFVGPLVRDEDDAPAEEDVDKDEFAEEQHLVAALVPLLHHDDDAALYALLSTAAKVFHASTARRVQYTMPPVIFAVLGLVRRVHARVAAGGEAGVPERTLFRFVHKATTSLASTHDQLGLRLFLQAAHVADGMGNNDVAYEFITQAFLVHEESADNRVEQQNILLLIGAMRAIRNLDASRYFDLARRTTQYAAKLFRKPEQCRMILRAAHLFWREGEPEGAGAGAGAAEKPEGADSDDDDDENKGPVPTAAGFQKASRVVKCLKQAAAIIEKHFEPNNVQLFVEILNGYIYFFDRCEPQIPASSINMLVQLVSTGLAGLSDEEAKATAKKHYDNTLALLRAKKADPQSQDRYREVEV